LSDEIEPSNDGLRTTIHKKEFAMGTATKGLNEAVRAQAAEIVTSGADVRPRLAEVVTKNVPRTQEFGEGLIGVVRAVLDGSQAGLARAVPKDRDDVFRQVVDALGDGLSQAALASRLAVEEAASTSRQFEKNDLKRLQDDLKAIQEMFAETVDRAVASSQALTSNQVAAARKHAERIAERLRPAVADALDAIGQHPIEAAREGLYAGVVAGRGAAGTLFETVGRMLERAGQQLHQDGKPR
jgi:hypothetical protein